MKKITWTANSMVKPITYDQFKTVTQLVNSRDIDPNFVLTAAKLNDDGSVTINGGTAPISTILAFDMVPNEKKPGEMRRNYKFLPNLNVVDASTLLDYLFKCPTKGSNNSPVQQTTAPLNTGGFGGAAS